MNAPSIHLSFSYLSMLPKLLTPTEVALLKGLSRTTVHNAMNSGKLPYVLFLGRRAIKESDAKAWTPPGRKTGRPKGVPVTEETKAKISAGQKKRWQLQQVRSAVGRRKKDG